MATISVVHIKFMENACIMFTDCPINCFFFYFFLLLFLRTRKQVTITACGSHELQMQTELLLKDVWNSNFVVVLNQLDVLKIFMQ